MAEKLVTLFSLLATTTCISCGNAVQLPEPDEIQEMTATLEDFSTPSGLSFKPLDGKSAVTFSVPKSHRKPILDALKPYQYDGSPAKWKVMGTLELTLKNGESFWIGLYSLNKKPGAFSAGPSFKSRTYFRGGDSKALLAALSAAHEASLKEQDKSK
ncbi:MAG: hypothetical protein ACE5KM_15605 [Planctomycetaceae bacterium]